jgi:hypothetical protein
MGKNVKCYSNRKYFLKIDILKAIMKGKHVLDKTVIDGSLYLNII